jgi:hypothetical protein
MKTKQSTPQFGLCLDWETSGAAFGEDSSKIYQGLSFGAIVFNTKTFEPVEEMYRVIQFDETKWKWSDDAQKIHGMSKEHTIENGVSAEQAAADLLEMIFKYFGTGKVMFLGHNPEFDRRFTNQLLNNINIEFSVERTQPQMEGWCQVHHVMLDTSALGFITLGLFKSDLLFDSLGFEERGEHNALQDAMQTLQTCQAIRQLVQIGMGEL